MDELMKLHKRKIKITESKHIYLSEQTLFKADGGEGLHLWESAIIFSRYINKYPHQFQGKKVIELGSGCGLLGIACLKYTNCVQLTLSDYQDSVIDNLINNLKENKNNNHQHINECFEGFLQKDKKEENKLIEKNNDNSQSNSDINHCLACYPGRYSFMKLDWRDYDKYKVESFDFVIGAELVWQGGCVEELVKIIRNLLNNSGKALIAMPKKRSMTEMFLKFIESNEMNYTSLCLDEEELFGDVLDNEKESKKLFEDLRVTNVVVYEIKKN